MMLRCSSPMALVGAILAAGVSLGLQPTPTYAAAVNPNAPHSTVTADYRLINIGSSLPVPDASSQGPQVVALVTPTGGIVPPTLANGSQGTPLTVLPDSSGFDANQLVVGLKDTTSGPPEQQFGLSFYGQGLQTGGVVHFALSIDSSLASNPPVLQSQTPNIVIMADSLPPVTPPITSGGGELLRRWPRASRAGLDGALVGPSGRRRHPPAPAATIAVTLRQSPSIGMASPRRECDPTRARDRCREPRKPRPGRKPPGRGLLRSYRAGPVRIATHSAGSSGQARFAVSFAR